MGIVTTFSIGYDYSFVVAESEDTLAPTLTATVISPTEIRLSWIPPTITFGQTIAEYVIEREITYGVHEEIGIVDGQTTTYTVGDLQTGKTYTFVVYANFPVGGSPNSNSASATPTTNSTDNYETSKTIPKEDNLTKAKIPDWIKNNAKWWSAYQISDKDFVKGIEYLVQKGILEVPQTKSNSSSPGEIPSWLRNNANWWSQGLLSDDEFVKGIQYLTSNNIIRISQESPSCLGNSICIFATVERVVDGDTIYADGYKIRLSLTNTPERNESGFSNATEFTKELCPVGSVITIDQDDKQHYDKYGRLLGTIHCGDKNLNSELLYNGHANILSQYCSSSEFANESWAQMYGCGDSQELKQTQSTPKTTQNTENCDPSYPDFCIPPPPPDLDCKDIPEKRFTVLQPDPHGFDGDKDGVGCES